MATIWIGSWRLHPETSELRRGSERLRLTPLERDLLRYLGQRPGQTVSREQLLREVWDYAPGSRSRALFSTVARVRTKLGEDGACLVSVYGQGYRLEPTEDPDLVGRRGDLGRLTTALESERGVVLWGLGGVGKTRLARSARTAGETIWLDVTGLTDLGETRTALARALALETDRAEAIELALQVPIPRRIVFDGAERLGPALCGEVRRWLDTSPALQVLITSRLRFAAGLAELHVAPLDDGAAELLFRRRADPTVALDDATVRELVSRLGGLPLAIELAAARTSVLTPKQLLQRIERDLGVLEVGERGLRSTLELSWALLEPGDRQILRLACLFSNPFGLEQLERVVETRDRLDRGAAPPAGVLEGLDHLVAASLVVRDGVRWRLIGPVRAFVADKVATADHDAYVTAAAGRARDLWTDPARGSDAHLATLVEEAPFLVDALSMATDTAHTAELAVALAHHDVLVGPVGRTRSVLERLSPQELPPRLAAEVSLRLAVQVARDDRPGATALARRALALAREAEDSEAIVDAWRTVADLTFGEREHAEHRAALAEISADPRGLRIETQVRLLCDEARFLLRTGRPSEAHDTLVTALALLGDGNLDLRSAIVKSLSEALDELGRTSDAIELLQRTFDEAVPGSGAYVRVGVGLAATLIDHGESTRAAALLPRVLDAAREGGFTSVEAVATLNLVAVTRNPVEAEQLCVRAREVARRAGRLDLMAGAERRIARRKLARGEVESARDAYERALAWLGPHARGRAYLRLQLALAQWANGDAETARTTVTNTEPTGSDREVRDLVRAVVDDDLETFEILARASRSTHSRVRVTISLVRQLLGQEGS